MTQRRKSAARPTIDLTEVDDEKTEGGPTSTTSTSHDSDDLGSRIDSNTTAYTASDPMDHDSTQGVQGTYSKQEFDDISFAQFIPWDFTSDMQDAKDYQRLPGYKEESDEHTDILMNPLRVQSQETKKVMNDAAIEIVDLTMLD